MAAVIGVFVLVGVAMGTALYRYPPSAGIAVAGGLALLALLVLALAQYEAAVVFGLLLMGVATFEPSPSDLIFAVVIAVAAVTGRLDMSRVPLPIAGLIGAFLVLNIVSAIEAVDPADAGTFFAITLYLGLFGVWLAGFVDSERRARIVLLAYLAAATWSAAVGTLALLAAVPGRDSLLSYGGTRATALFQDPNIFGAFLVPAALFLLEEILRPRLLRLARPTKVAVFLLLVVGILFSYSRGAWLALGVGVLSMLVVLALRRRGGRRAAALLGVMLVTGAVGAAAIAVTGSVGFLEQRTAFQTYDSDRLGAQRRGIALARTYPLGAGPGQFENIVAVRSRDISSHSIYVRALVEQGVVGLAVILALLLGTLLLAMRNAAAGNDTYGIGSAALFGAWCGILVSGFFVDTLHWRHLWIVAALVWAGAARGWLRSARE